jgi:hypothetical protein
VLPLFVVDVVLEQENETTSTYNKVKHQKIIENKAITITLHQQQQKKQT